MHKQLEVDFCDARLTLILSGELDVYHVASLQAAVDKISFSDVTSVTIDLQNLSYLDTTGALYLSRVERKLQKRTITVNFLFKNDDQLATLEMVKKNIGEADALFKKKRSLHL